MIYQHEKGCLEFSMKKKCIQYFKKIKTILQFITVVSYLDVLQGTTFLHLLTSLPTWEKQKCPETIIHKQSSNSLTHKQSHKPHKILCRQYDNVYYYS